MSYLRSILSLADCAIHGDRPTPKPLYGVIYNPLKRPDLYEGETFIRLVYADGSTRDIPHWHSSYHYYCRKYAGR